MGPGVTRGRALDAALVALLLLAGWFAWSRGAAPGDPALPPGTPAWAGFRDLLLDGPDAGRWAEQAIALGAGAFSRLDPHRLPTWTLLTVAVGRVWGLDVPLAGHLTNHLLQLGLGALVFGLGRAARMGRGPAAAAALAVLLQPELRSGASRFQVDVAVSVAWPAVLAAALAGGRSRLGAALAGAVAALGFTTHFTTLPAVVPAVVALVGAAPPGRRLRALGAFTLPFVGVAWAIHRVLPPMPLSLLLPSVMAGMVPIDQAHAPVAEPPLQRVMDAVRLNGAVATTSALRWLGSTVSGGRVEGGWIVGLMGLGALGPGLGRRPEVPPGWVGRVPRGVRLQAEWAARGVVAGGAVALALAPVPVLFLAGAPLRYANTFLPLVLLLVFRGLAGLGAAAAAAWGRLRPGARGGAAFGAGFAGLFAIGTLVGRPSPSLAAIDADAALMVEIGAAIRERYPPGSDVAAFVHEVSAAAGGLACPTPDCPTSTTDAALARCVDTIRASCVGGADSVPYAVVVTRPRDDRFVTRAALDAYVLARWAPFATFEDDTLSVSLVAVPRRAGE